MDNLNNLMFFIAGMVGSFVVLSISHNREKNDTIKTKKQKWTSIKSLNYNFKTENPIAFKQDITPTEIVKIVAASMIVRVDQDLKESNQIAIDQGDYDLAYNLDITFTKRENLTVKDEIDRTGQE
jgi:hypothetical protein